MLTQVWHLEQIERSCDTMTLKWFDLHLYRCAMLKVLGTGAVC